MHVHIFTAEKKPETGIMVTHLTAVGYLELIYKENIPETASHKKRRDSRKPHYCRNNGKIENRKFSETEIGQKQKGQKKNRLQLKGHGQPKENECTYKFSFQKKQDCQHQPESINGVALRPCS